MVLRPKEGISAIVIIAVMAFLTFLCGYYYGRRAARQECGQYVFELVYGVEVKN